MQRNRDTSLGAFAMAVALAIPFRRWYVCLTALSGEVCYGDSSSLEPIPFIPARSVNLVG